MAATHDKSQTQPQQSFSTEFRYVATKSSNTSPNKQRLLPKPVDKKQLISHIQSIKSAFSEDELICKVVGLCQQRIEPEQTICYGLGSVTASSAARIQLGFLLALREKMSKNEKDSPLWAFDPLFNVDDTEILQEVGCKIINSNEGCKRHVDSTALFFMPHCGRALYNNVIWSNWSNLQSIVIVGNSFQQMTETLKPQEYECLQQAMVCAEELAVPVRHLKGTVFTAMQSTSIHFFTTPASPLPPADSVDIADPEFVPA